MIREGDQQQSAIHTFLFNLGARGYQVQPASLPELTLFWSGP
jgi:hypothetical protein